MRFKTALWGVIGHLTVLSQASAEFEVRRLITGLNQPLYLTSAPGDSDRLFVVEKGGDIEIIDRQTGQWNTTPFLDVSREISTNSERGLLGLAFHPEYESNGLLYVNLTNRSGNTEIRQYQVSDDPDLVDGSSSTNVISIAQPFSNHNGGWIDFGPDGFLYVGMGDGGSGDDPQDHGQRLNTHLGKMLRLDINGDDFPNDDQLNYSIPDGNPFTMDRESGALPEIWAYGLRNPWRNSFDSVTGDLYIADVGQNVREEINFQHADSNGGENYGWRLREGAIRTPGSVGGNPPRGNVDPVYDYLHGGGSNRGNSITGGNVYHGPVAELQNQYVFGDFTSSRIWSIEVDRDTGSLVHGSFTDWTREFRPDRGRIDSIVSFGADNFGNLYVIDFGGEVFAVVPEPHPYLLLSMVLVGLLQLRTGKQRPDRVSAGAR